MNHPAATRIILTVYEPGGERLTYETRSDKVVCAGGFYHFLDVKANKMISTNLPVHASDTGEDVSAKVVVV